MTASMGSHQSARMLSDTWLTPPGIITAFGPFDLDPCAAPEPRPWPTATRHICPPDDGLASIWSGRVWLNPPYSREAATWLAKMAQHGHGITLTFARTETEWFVKSIWQKASALLFLHGRIYFHRIDGSRAAGNAGAPSVLAAYGNDDARQLRLCELPGTYVQLEAGNGYC